MSAVRHSYTFKEGLTMMAAKAIGVDPELAAEAGENARAAINAIRNALKTKDEKTRAAHIRDAQQEIRVLSPSKHGALISVLNAKILALQGRGGDTEVAHVAPGEVVVPRELLTPDLIELIAVEAINHGIDPRRLTVGAQDSVNPETGAEEFGVFNTIKGWFTGQDKDQLDMTGIDKPLSVTRPTLLGIEPIQVSASRRVERLDQPSTYQHGPYDGAALGVGGYMADQLIRGGNERIRLAGEVGKLGPNDTVQRSWLKSESRERTPKPFRELIKEVRPGLDALPGSGGTANRTNPVVDAAGRVGRAGGAGLAALSIANARDRISSAEDKARETFGVMGSLAGGYLGGVGGAALGKGVASLPLAVAGSTAGGAAGEKAGYGIYDGYQRYLRNLYHFGF